MALPSLSESFGVAALEGSSMGKPVVASAVGGLPEVIDHNETGILVQPGDVDGIAAALDFLFLNPSERKRLGENGRKKVMQYYNIKSNTDTMIDIYRKLLSYD
ncbi:Capsular glucan synthase [compost metagenome]